MTRRSPPAPTLNHTPGTALHRQIFMLLRDEIARGIYSSTGALPKEEALCDRFSVSRITVRRALADLAALGLIVRRHGKGSFVADNVPSTRAVPTLGVLDSLRRTAIETTVKVLKVEHVTAPPDIAELLQISSDERATHALRLRSVGSIPVMLTESWVPEEMGRYVTTAALRAKPLYEILMEHGVRFGRVVQEFTTQIIDPTRAAWMNVETGTALLKMVRLMHDQDAHPVQHLTVLLSSERSRVLMDIPGEHINTLGAGQIMHDLLPQHSRAKKHREP